MDFMPESIGNIKSSETSNRDVINAFPNLSTFSIGQERKRLRKEVRRTEERKKETT